ncbi:MAG: alpha-hydroxy acid oxidase [Hyphomicrobiales bacterium]
MTMITDIADLKALAKRRVPKMFYEYVDTGSWSQGTYLDNEAAFQRQKLRQRVAVNIENRSLATKMIGESVSMPVALAPIGLTGMQHADGEILSAQAAEEFGVPYTLTTMAICSIEDVAAHTKKPFWFQLYVMRDRGFTESLIARAKAANCSALVLTLDLQLIGQRHRDLKNGLSTPPKITPRFVAEMMIKPLWCMQMLKTKRHTFGNIVGHAPGVDNMLSLSEWTAEQFDQSLDWSSVEWIRQHWDRKLILKGINDVEDAKIASELGADAIVVSNHGGRQLDGAVASFDVLRDIVDAVGDKVEVHFDSGIRSGQDVFKAIAMGAKGTFLGRAYIYGLGAMGKPGVTKALEIVHKELDTTMGLCGERDIKKVGRHNLVL